MRSTCMPFRKKVRLKGKPRWRRDTNWNASGEEWQEIWKDGSLCGASIDIPHEVDLEVNIYSVMRMDGHIGDCLPIKSFHDLLVSLQIVTK